MTTDNTDREELEPCPFCGVVPVMQSHAQEDEMDEERYVFFVECANSKCPMGLVSTGGPFREAGGAAKQWNSRAAVAAPQGDDWIAWLRYVNHGQYEDSGADIITIEVCDSDAKGAFKVYCASPVAPSLPEQEPKPCCVKCGHSAGVERTLKRCKARIDGGEALCQCHCEFPTPTPSTATSGAREVAKTLGAGALLYTARQLRDDVLYQYLDQSPEPGLFEFLNWLTEQEEKANDQV